MFIKFFNVLKLNIQIKKFKPTESSDFISQALKKYLFRKLKVKHVIKKTPEKDSGF